MQCLQQQIQDLRFKINAREILFDKDLENFVERFKDIGKNLNLLSTYYLYDILEAGE